MDYYVDQLNGNDTNNGLAWSTAFATITKAMMNNTNLLEGDSIYINEGTYQETVQMDPQVNIYGIGKVILDGMNTTDGIWVRACNIETVIKNITFINHKNHSLYASAVLNSGKVSVEYCMFKNILLSAIEPYQGNQIIEANHCVFKNNKYGVFLYYSYRTHNFKFNIFINNEQAIKFYSSSSTYNIQYIKNNIFINNTDAALSFGDNQKNINNAVINNNCFYGNTADYDWGNNTPNPDTASINADPLLTDEANEIFTLNSASPCLAEADDHVNSIGAYNLGNNISDFSGWALTDCSINGSNDIQLDDVVSSGTAESPVIDLGSTSTKIEQIAWTKTEELLNPTTARGIVDSDNTTSPREIEYRSGDTNNLSAVSYIKITSGQVLNVQNRYIQFKVTLRRDGI